MSDQTPTDQPEQHSPPPATTPDWPRTLDDFMRDEMCVAGLCRHLKLRRVRDFEAHLLRRVHPGASESDVSRRFYQRQKSGFESLDEWNTYSAEYRMWWQDQRQAIRERNASLFNKSLDQVNATDGKATDHATDHSDRERKSPGGDARTLP